MTNDVAAGHDVLTVSASDVHGSHDHTILKRLAQTRQRQVGRNVVPDGYRPSMDPFTIGADIAGMLVGVPVVAVGLIWLMRQWDARKQRKAMTRLRSLHGYAMPESAYASYVRVADGTDIPAGRIVLEILDREDGKPDALLAEGLRRVIVRDGMISSVPRQAEYAFLGQFRREPGYGNGVLVG
jgi:hypothetical protein